MGEAFIGSQERGEFKYGLHLFKVFLDPHLDGAIPPQGQRITPCSKPWSRHHRLQSLVL